MKHLLPLLSLLVIWSCSNQSPTEEKSIAFGLVSNTTAAGKVDTIYKDSIGTVFATYKKSTTVTWDSVVYLTSFIKKSGSVTPPPVDTTVVVISTAIQGFGSQATGGKDKPVYRVTNLNSSGNGSLVNGLGSNKTIVFDVAGTITARLDVYNMSNLTIDGLSAPSPGVTINNNNNGNGIGIENSVNVIVQGLRVTGAGMDGINVVASNTVVIKNCTSWGNGDGNIDIASDAQMVTVQDCIIGYGKSGYSGSMLVTARNVSVHHNLFVSTGNGGKGERNPLAHSNYTPVGNPNLDFVNNTVYKWDGYGTAICYNSTGNVINNYYYSVTSPDKAINKSDGYGNGNTGKVYASGNYGSTFTGTSIPFPIPNQYRVTTQPACVAAKLVMQNAGTKYPDGNETKFKNSVSLNCN